MQFPTPETFWLIVILLYVAAASVIAVIKSPHSGQGRFVWALVIGTALIQLSFDRQHYLLLLREDGPAEWATFYAFLFAGISFTVRAWQQRSSSGLPQLLSLALLGIFCFFVAGEEISWAQRLFSFRPPEVFLEHNFQQEVNVHNFLNKMSLAGFSLATENFVALIACLFGGLLPLVRCISPRAIRRIDAAVPNPGFIGFFLLVAWVEWMHPYNNSGEAAELYLGCLLLLSQRTSPRRRNHLLMAVIFFLGICTPPAANHIIYGASKANVATTRNEIRQIGLALIQPNVLQEKLFKSKYIHKRIFTAEKAGYLKLCTNNQFLKDRQASQIDAPGRKNRFDFYLDPWNNPYWIIWTRPERKLIIYSFGPNNSRDSSFKPKTRIRPDDITFILRVPVRQTKQKQTVHDMPE